MNEQLPSLFLFVRLCYYLLWVLWFTEGGYRIWLTLLCGFENCSFVFVLCWWLSGMENGLRQFLLCSYWSLKGATNDRKIRVSSQKFLYFWAQSLGVYLHRLFIGLIAGVPCTVWVSATQKKWSLRFMCWKKEWGVPSSGYEWKCPYWAGQIMDKNDIKIK